MKKNRTILAALAIALAPAPVLSGAWTQPEGQAYLRLSGGFLGAEERFDADGNRIDFDETVPTRWEDFAAAFYGELGLAPGYTFVTDFAWKKIRADGAEGDPVTTGLADAGVGLRVRVYAGKTTVASLMGFVTFPTGYDPDDYPSLGSDVTDASLTVQLGDASDEGSWANGEAFFKFRGGGFRNQIGAALTMGFDVVPRRAGFRAEARGGLPIGEERTVAPTSQVDPAQIDPSFFDLAAVAAVSLPDGFAIEAEVRHTIGGKNTLKGTRWGLALVRSGLSLWVPSPRVTGGAE